MSAALMKRPRFTSVFVPGSYFTKGFVQGLVGQSYQGVMDRLMGTKYRSVAEGFSRHGDLMRMDAITRRELGRVMEKARCFTLSPLNIMHYLFLKEREIATLRGILIAKAYGMEAERLGEVLVIG